MGGIGSGTWCRWDKKTTAEEIKRIDIRYLKRCGWLSPGYYGSLSWQCMGEPSGNINFQVYQLKMVLKYRYQDWDDEWQSIEEDVWFDRTPCNYGGERPWFRCPHCGRRVAVLYGAGVRFLCRHCYGLPYGSQCEGAIDRMMRKARKIRARLGASDDLDEPVWEKPKGMHWETFERLTNQSEHIAEAVDMAIFNHFGRLM